MAKLRVGGGPAVADWSGFNPLPRRHAGYAARVGEVVDSGVWDGLADDRWIRAFEQAWARFNQAAHCVAVTNGTHALQLALEAAEIGPADEVIVPAITWYTTASAVCDVNAVPVIADVDPDSACLTLPAVERALGPRTRAIIVVHLYQQLADVAALRRLAVRHGLTLIEDCAHAHGARWQHGGPGSLGDFGCYSFQMGKLISSGEGGAILTRSANLHQRLLSLRNCGRSVEDTRVHSGNYRMTSLQSELLLQQIEGFEQVSRRLDDCVRSLERAVLGVPGFRPLQSGPDVARRCGFRFAFKLDPSWFEGISASTLRAALSAELNLPFHAGDAPLNRAVAYRPHLKRRHQWDAQYAAALNPSRWHVPVAESLYERELMVADWRILGCPPERSHELAQALRKLSEQRDELRALQARSR